MHLIWDGAVGYVTTAVRTAKLNQSAATPWMSLAYIAEPFCPTYGKRAVQIRNGRATKHDVWGLFVRTPEPLGSDLSSVWGEEDNPGYGVICLESRRIELCNLLNQDQRIVWERGGL